MRHPRGAVFLALALLLGLLVAGGSRSTQPASAATLPYRVVSDSYYHVDPAAATMSVRVQATYYNNQSGDLVALPVFAMPEAKEISVKIADTDAKISVTPYTAASATLVMVTLPTPLKSQKKIDLVATYTVGAQSTSWTHIAPGVVESPFVSQGVGSFVIVDVPAAAENYFDPGCIQAAGQPSEVKDAGYQRWVCGEMLGAVFGRSASTERACANMEDRCRQLSLNGWVIAFAQSITDTANRGTLDADVAMSRKPLHVTFRYFKHDEAWAKKQMAVVVQALPMIEKLYGFPFPFDDLSLRESHHIEFGGALGIAYNSGGDILVAPDTGIDSEVTTHELGHEWAGGNMGEPWMAEGLAEWSQRSLAGTIGYTPTDRHWAQYPYKDNLALWGNGTTVDDADYWYGKAGAFFFDLEKAVGGRDTFTKVLAGADPHTAPIPLDGRWLMDQAERVSGANLDDLFLKWVFNPQTAPATLKERREAHNAVQALTARVTALGFSGLPSDIQQNLDSWSFSAIQTEVAQANKTLDAYVAAVAMGNDAGLGASAGVARAWGSESLAGIQSVVDDQKNVIKAITGAATDLANEPDGSPARKQLEQAKQKYVEGDFSEAKRLASGSTETQFNQSAAGKLIELAKKKEREFKPSFLGKVGMWFVDPAADLAKAQQAYDSGDPRKALSLSRSAYDGWNDAESRGLQRLAILAGVMCGLSAGTWYLLRRMNPPAQAVAAGQGHFIEPSQFRWKDWENSGRGR